jgi:glycosyltransferase involved in cell wall biosynthesis
MKISAFTIVRNAVKFNYPVVPSIRSILPICDEFIVNVGDSQDGTLDLIRSMDSPKIRIIQSQWDMGQGSQVLSQQTNLALKECKGDWAFYLQSDEVIHEADLNKLKFWMQHYLNQKNVDALRLWWFHFYGSFWRYRIDSGWYQKQDRIIRNNGHIESYGDAYGFRRIDGKPLRTRLTFCYLYHYGWANSKEAMKKRYDNASAIGYMNKKMSIPIKDDFGDLNRFPAYLGTHPAVMKEKVAGHQLSREDFDIIRRKLWWNPAFWLRLRYKTGRRVKERIA